jgi:hypothetical protein
MITNSFSSDLEFIFNKLKNREHFSFSKYADGEYKVLKNEFITNCDNWTFDPQLNRQEHRALFSSFQYSHPDYIIGISCPCCQPIEQIQWMRNNVKTSIITWANLLVNGNYDFFKKKFFPLFNKWEGLVNLIANKNGLNKEMPFKVDNYIPIHPNKGWLNPDLLDNINKTKELARNENGQLFLFSGGPLGNILAHQLHLINQNNTYLDIGSTINPWITGNNRGYFYHNKNKNCIW